MQADRSLGPSCVVQLHARMRTRANFAGGCSVITLNHLLLRADMNWACSLGAQQGRVGLISEFQIRCPVPQPGSPAPTRCGVLSAPKTMHRQYVLASSRVRSQLSFQ